MYVSLPQEQEQFIQEQLRKGKYSNADDVIRDALKLLEERQLQENKKRLEELRQQIAIGTEQIARGQVVDGEVVFDRLREKIRSFSQEQP